MTTTGLRIHKVIADNNTRRLHYFAGRYLSEQEFDLMQVYVDERCEDLVRTSLPGIIYGLETSVNPNDEALDITVQPGLAVGGDGKVVQVSFPIHLDWGSLIDEFKTRVTVEDLPQAATHGYYFLTVKRLTALIDDSKAADPCSRRDPNPLRDSRLETFATLDLFFITNIPSWMSMTERQASVRVMVRYLQESAFDAETGAVPIALVKINNDSMEWINTDVGRFFSQKNNVHYNLLSYWQSLEKNMSLTDEHDSSLDLASILGVDYLPAAGPFPDDLITDISGKESENPDLWTRPTLHFNPYDLQIELLPVPANSVDGVITTELARGVVDLVHYQHDRIRIMVAVEPDDYRVDLMNLPEIDLALIKEFHERYIQSASDYNAWAIKFYELYGNLDRDVTFPPDKPDEPDEDSALVFNSIYKVAGPTGDFPKINTEVKRKSLKIPVAQPAPQTVSDYLRSIIEQRENQSPNGKAPRPYSQSLPDLPDDQPSPEFPEDIQDGLYRQQLDLKKKIQTIEEFLETGSDLLNEISDFLSLQRQQLDSITVSFASLAGGVAGDGSGLNLMRWSDEVNYVPPILKPAEE